MFLMWLGEQITSRGIGNGVSLIIMAGIVAQLPVTLTNLFQSGREGAISGLLIIGSLGMARSEEHTSKLQSLMRISYAVFCLKKKNNHIINNNTENITH